MKQVKIELTPEQAEALQPLVSYLNAIGASCFYGATIGQVINPNHHAEPDAPFRYAVFSVVDHEAAAEIARAMKDYSLRNRNARIERHIQRASKRRQRRKGNHMDMTYKDISDVMDRWLLKAMVHEAAAEDNLDRIPNHDRRVTIAAAFAAMRQAAAMERLADAQTPAAPAEQTSATDEIGHIRQDAIDAVKIAANGDTLGAIHNLHAAVLRLCDLLEDR